MFYGLIIQNVKNHLNTYVQPTLAKKYIIKQKNINILHEKFLLYYIYIYYIYMHIMWLSHMKLNAISSKIHLPAEILKNGYNLEQFLSGVTIRKDNVTWITHPQTFTTLEPLLSLSMRSSLNLISVHLKTVSPN